MDVSNISEENFQSVICGDANPHFKDSTFLRTRLEIQKALPKKIGEEIVFPDLNDIGIKCKSLGNYTEHGSFANNSVDLFNYLNLNSKNNTFPIQLKTEIRDLVTEYFRTHTYDHGLLHDINKDYLIPKDFKSQASNLSICNESITDILQSIDEIIKENELYFSILKLKSKGFWHTSLLLIKKDENKKLPQYIPHKYIPGNYIIINGITTEIRPEPFSFYYEKDSKIDKWDVSQFLFK